MNQPGQQADAPATVAPTFQRRDDVWSTEVRGGGTHGSYLDVTPKDGITKELRELAEAVEPEVKL